MTTEHDRTCYVMGNGSLLVSCAEILLGEGFRLLGVVTSNPEIEGWAGTRGLRVLAPGKDLAARLGDAPFDWFFSIANLEILPEDVLARARRGAVNFHDGPLPRYAGLNAPVWAILAGEPTHGITWHLIEGGVDEGDVLEQRVFPIGERETCLTLNTRCYEAAIESFRDVARGIADDTLARRPQDLTKRSYFGKHQRPAAVCAADFREPARRVDALVRALDHGRYPNPVGVAKALLAGGGAVALPSCERASESVAHEPGTVVAVGVEGLEVATQTGTLRFPEVRDLEGRVLGADALEALGLRAGARLDLDDARRARLGAADAELARHEGFFAKRLATLAAAQLPQAERGALAAGPLAQVDLPAGGSPARLLAGLAAWLLRVTGKEVADVGYRSAALAARLEGVADLYAAHVPARLVVDRAAPFADLEVEAAAELRRLEKRGSYLRDLVARQPEAQAPAWELLFEEVASLEGYALPAGAAAAVLTDGAAARLVFDAARLPAEAARDLASQLEALLAAAAKDPSVAVGRLPLLSEADAHRVLVAWNDSTRPFPEDRGVHQLFEEQVLRTPDAVALVHEDRSLTYAELDRRANRLAHHLRALGVGPDVPVGLCTDRSFDLLVGALGILKAGGAYLPLDPTYPADRLAFMLEDSGAPFLVTQPALRERVPAGRAQVVELGEGLDLSACPETRPEVPGFGSRSLAYLIYTSGSTGRPKGVMVEHRNVSNFFVGMDERIAHDPAGTWLAVTSLSFDISVLELFWTLARGFQVVLASDADRATVSGGATVRRANDRHIDFSLFYFASDEGEKAADKYRLLLDGARFADAHGFSAVWTPERHFHAFGGLYPNPSVASAAIAAVTERVRIRAGSCVSPLHHPIRIAEEWALVDNLSNGRVDISFAAGWQPNDFVLRPQTFRRNKDQMVEDIETIARLWRGEAVSFEGPVGPVEVRTLPRPVQPELPFMITAAGNPETFELAGRMGGGILTHLLGQSLDDAREKIAIYRKAWKEAGHPGEGTVVLMLHTFVGDDDDEVKEIVRGPMKDYLRSSIALIQKHAWAFPAFKAVADESKSFKDNFENLSDEDTEALLDHSFERYYQTSGLFGTPETARRMVEACRGIGVDEIGCLIDFGIDSQTVLDSLPMLDRVRAASQADVTEVAEDDFSIAAQLVRHRVTHMQCTPSMARMLVTNPDSRAALSGLSHLMVGGEALPVSLAEEIRAATSATLTNMYGPTETTIWSSTDRVDPAEGVVTIGTPIANNRLYVLDESLEPVPVGVPGELYIGGDGVTRGYHARPELTAERFVADPFTGGDARMYRTGDEVKWRPDGRIAFVGRIDNQVKLRGYRIELGEIESTLESHPSVREAVVIAREDNPGDKRLVAYVIPEGRLDLEALGDHLRESLPTFMVPAHVVTMDRYPLTPNKKVDRKALPRPELRATSDAPRVAPEGETERQIAEIWRRLLGLDDVGTRDNFFDLGGHSLLAVQAHREICETTGKKLTVTDIFRFPTIGALAAHLDGDGEADKSLAKVAERAASRRQAREGRRVLRRR